MSCEEYQLMTSKLLDGEVLPDASHMVFAHLASCAECRGFFYKVQNMNASLSRMAEPLAGKSVRKVTFHPRLNVVMEKNLWRRRVSFSLPVVVIAICVLIMALVFSVRKTAKPELVYITELPTVVVNANKTTSNSNN